MTALNQQVPEDPLDRLNYFNSQRLEAVDFRVEQLYHMRVRRWLNRALYSAGIASGLEVTKHPTDKHAVVVSPGLALDALGREIIVLEAQTVRVRGVPKRADGVQFGNYLVLAYSEEKVAPQQDGCRVMLVDAAYSAPDCCRGGAKNATTDCGGGCGCGGCGGGCGGSGAVGCGCSGGATMRGAQEQSWGAPSRIRSTPLLSFQSAFPSENQGRILLAQVVLNATCQVEDIKSGMRRYATAVKPPNTTPLSLEGEKDVDKNNPKVLRFHIEGGYPDSASLYLKAEQFTSLFYTEMGKHGHEVGVTMDPNGGVAAHNHALANVVTIAEGGEHTHSVHAHVDEDPNEADNVIVVNDTDAFTANLVDKFDFQLGPGKHQHGFAADAVTGANGAMADHRHTLHVTQTSAGVWDVNARTGAAQHAHTYVNQLHVQLDGMDITNGILVQLQALNAAAWAELGDGTDAHELAKNGTGRIDLRLIPGVDLAPGPHDLVFAVSNGGGRIQYNLYVS
jgi:hypothetical protein